MSERRQRRIVIDAEQVVIRANEVFVIEDEDRRRHRKPDRFDNDVAGVFEDEDRKRHDRFDNDFVAGVEDDHERKHRRGIRWI